MVSMGFVFQDVLGFSVCFENEWKLGETKEMNGDVVKVNVCGWGSEGRKKKKTTMMLC